MISEDSEHFEADGCPAERGRRRTARPESRYCTDQMPHARTTRKPAPKPSGGPRTYGRLQRALDDAARREIKAALKESGGNVSEAARLLGIGRPRLWARMKVLGIASRR